MACGSCCPTAERTPAGAALTSYSLHLHASRLDAALGQALLGDDAADVVREDEGGLQDGEGLGMGAGCRLVDGDIQGAAVVLHAGHLHVLRGEEAKERVSVRFRGKVAARKLWIHVSSRMRSPRLNFAFALEETISPPSLRESRMGTNQARPGGK